MSIFKSTSVTLVVFLIASPLTATATELDAVLARLEKLEAENKKIASENALLRDRVNHLEAKGPTVSANKAQSGNKQ